MTGVVHVHQSLVRLLHELDWRNAELDRLVVWQLDDDVENQIEHVGIVLLLPADMCLSSGSNRSGGRSGRGGGVGGVRFRISLRLLCVRLPVNHIVVLLVALTWNAINVLEKLSDAERQKLFTASTDMPQPHVWNAHRWWTEPFRDKCSCSQMRVAFAASEFPKPSEPEPQHSFGVWLYEASAAEASTNTKNLSPLRYATLSSEALKMFALSHALMTFGSLSSQSRESPTRWPRVERSHELRRATKSQNENLNRNRELTPSSGSSWETKIGTRVVADSVCVFFSFCFVCCWLVEQEVFTSFIGCSRLLLLV